jgi:hypothetical protein
VDVWCAGFQGWSSGRAQGEERWPCRSLNSVTWHANISLC